MAHSVAAATVQGQDNAVTSAFTKPYQPQIRSSNIFHTHTYNYDTLLLEVL